MDRGYVSMPSSALLKLEVAAEVIAAPETLFYAGVSDHAPVVFTFGFGVLCKSHLREFKAPLLSKALKSLLKSLTSVA